MIYFIYFLIVVAFIDTFSQLPIMSPFAQDLGASALMIGLIIGMYSFTNIAGNMIAGYYIDKKGVKDMLTFGLLATGVILIIYAGVTSPTQLLAVRFLHGLTGGLLIPTAFTYLANSNTEKKQGKTMALSGASVGLASIIGPAYGGIISSQFGTEMVFITIGILMIVTALLAWLFLKNDVSNPELDIEKSDSNQNINDLFKQTGLLLSYIGAFSLMFSQGILAYELPLLVLKLGYDSSMSGMLMSVFAIVATLIFILPTNRLYDYFSHTKTMLSGLIMLGLALAMLAFATSHMLLLATMIFYGVGFALIFPSITALVASNSGISARGKAYGLFYGFFSLGVVAGTFVTGIFAETIINVFLIGTIWLLTSVIIMWVISNRKAE